MSSALAKEVSKGTDGSAAAATKVDDKSVWQASKPLIQLAVFTGCGVACGFTFEKARVIDPAVIQDQMEFSRFVMLKMFLSAVTTGLVSFSVLSIIPATKQKFAMARESFAAPLRNKGAFSSLVGGALLGMGLTLSGTCPGMVFVQLGGGVPNAVYTLLGGFTGVLAYGMIHPFIRSAIKPAKPAKYEWLDQYMSTSFAAMALPTAVAIASIVAAVEYASPWKTEVITTSMNNYLTTASWSPIFSGVVIGLAQIPLVLLIDDTLGSSTAYCTVMSQLIPTSLSKTSLLRYFDNVINNMESWWQVIFMTSYMLASYASSNLSGSYASVDGVGIQNAFIGGFLLLFGARLASGCTSGHGLSGIGLLNMLSFVNVPSIFAGGMGLQFIRNLL